MIQTSI